MAAVMMSWRPLKGDPPLGLADAHMRAIKGATAATTSTTIPPFLCALTRFSAQTQLNIYLQSAGRKTAAATIKSVTPVALNISLGERKHSWREVFSFFFKVRPTEADEEHRQEAPMENPDSRTMRQSPNGVSGIMGKFGRCYPDLA